MSLPLSLHYPLQSIFFKKNSTQLWRCTVLFLIGIGLLTLSSKLNIPLHPIPITLQTWVVLLIGMTYGPRLGAVTVLAFVTLGLMGLPILAGVLSGASIGYLIGFIPAAFLSGILVQNGWGRSVVFTALAAVLGMVVIYACGLVWLSAYVGFALAFKLGLEPFIPFMIVKIIVLALVVPRFWKA